MYTPLQINLYKLGYKLDSYFTKLADILKENYLKSYLQYNRITDVAR